MVAVPVGCVRMCAAAWTGLLDCTVPGAVYAVGAAIHHYPWGLVSVWVYAGYICDVTPLGT